MKRRPSTAITAAEIRQTLVEAMKAALWFFFLMWGVVLSAGSLVLLLASGLGHIPFWHPAIMAFAALVSLSLSHIAS